MSAASVVIALVELDQLSHLMPLAADLAAQPMLQRYAIGAASLVRGWRVGIQAGDQVWAARRGDQVVGIAQGAATGGFGGPYLRFVGVAKRAQAQGIGGRLIRFFEADTAASATRGYFLLVADFNTEAQALYLRRGYQQVGRLPGFVRPGIDELIFWLPPTKA